MRIRLDEREPYSPQALMPGKIAYE